MIPRATVRRRRKFKIEFKAERKLKALTFGNEFILFRISVCFILMRVFYCNKIYIFSLLGNGICTEACSRELRSHWVVEGIP